MTRRRRRQVTCSLRIAITNCGSVVCPFSFAGFSLVRTNEDEFRAQETSYSRALAVGEIVPLPSDSEDAERTVSDQFTEEDGPDGMAVESVVK